MWLLCSVHSGSLHDLLVCGVRSLGSKYGLSLSILGFILLSPSLHLVGRRGEVCRWFSFLLGQQAPWLGPFLYGAWGNFMIFAEVRNFPEHTAKKALKAGNGIAQGVLTLPASYDFLILP